jgi:hypothetical protein
VAANEATERDDGWVVVEGEPEAPPEPTEGPDEDAVKAKLRGPYLRRIQQCYTQALTGNPNLAGTLSIKFTLLPSGKVAGMTAIGFDAGMDACVVASMKKWVFDNSGRRGGTFEFDFAFP